MTAKIIIMGDWQKFINEIKDKNDIVDVIGSYLRLTVRGRSVTAVCPFHPDRNPSMHINRSGQYYKCFACGASGDVIKFIEAYESLSFMEAVELLAKKAGISLPDRGDGERAAKEKKHRKTFLEITRESAVFYRECLKSAGGEAARRYLSARGISGKYISSFGLGYSPDYISLVRRIKEKGFDLKDAYSAGVLGFNEAKNDYFDSLGGRLIIPIINAQNEVLGFGGRILINDKKAAKYKNTSDTPLFDKSGTIYNINRVKKLKQDGALTNGVIVVEGYMDVIGLAVHGINPVVASMGTALTMRQARIIKRYTDEVFICFDGDSAGQSGALRGMDILRDEGLKVKVMTMPEGLDPDEFANKFGKDGFLSCAESALPLTNYKLYLLSKKYDLAHANPIIQQENRTAFTQEALKIIDKLEDTIERESFVQDLSVKTSFAPAVLNDALQSISQSNSKPVEPHALAQDFAKLTLEQRALLYIASSMLNNKPYVIWERPDSQALPELEPIFEYIFSEKERGGQVSFARAYDILKGNVALLELLDDGLNPSEGKFYSDCRATLEIAAAKRKIGELLKNATAESSKEIMLLSRRIKELEGLY